MNIQYFYIKDMLERQGLNIKIAHCPAEDMYGDYLSKPIQGVLFYKFRNKIKNI